MVCHLAVSCVQVYVKKFKRAKVSSTESVSKSQLFGVQVRFAKNTNKVQPTTEPNDRNQLFFARAPIKATEAEIREVFAEFGEVRMRINILITYRFMR